MDTFHHRFLNRDVFEPVFVIPNRPDPADVPFDPSMEYIYTGADDRFSKLVEIFSGVDIVQFPGGFSPAICEAARQARVPALVETMHLCEPGQLYPDIDVTICVSETVRKYQPDQSKTAVVLNGIDLAEFPFREQPAPGNRVVVLESARREKPKHFHLDELAEELLPLDPRLELWLAGRNQTGPSTGRVKFMGLSGDMGALYAKADIMLLVSKVEPFGLVALEAMACGALPIVAGDGGMAEIVTHGVDGWIVKGDDRRDIADTVKQALAIRGTPLWEQMRRAAREKVEKRFDARHCVAGYEKIYLELLEKKGRRKDHGPFTPRPTPETALDDAVNHFNIGDWQGIEQDIKQMADSTGLFTIPLCAKVAADLGMQAFARGENELAERVFEKLFRSGLRGKNWMRQWASITPEGELKLSALAELVRLEPGNPETVMLYAEALIMAGRMDEALTALAEGALLNPIATELSETLELLKRKLAGNR